MKHVILSPLEFPIVVVTLLLKEDGTFKWTRYQDVVTVILTPVL